MESESTTLEEVRLRVLHELKRRQASDARYTLSLFARQLGVEVSVLWRFLHLFKTPPREELAKILAGIKQP